MYNLQGKWVKYILVSIISQSKKITSVHFHRSLIFKRWFYQLCTCHNIQQVTLLLPRQVYLFLVIVLKSV